MELQDAGGGIGNETIYGTHEDSHVVMSEKVQSLAGSIYQEFERMIARYDEDVVKSLMPLLVNVLECLDAAYQANQEQDVELELLREDNEQLVTQYEREKGARKTSEQKLLEIEDAAEGERKELSARLEALESIVRMLELKHKNSMEHAGRLEEREAELKKEYAKLHERYTELFKTHMDYMERTKLLLSGQQLANERAEAGRINAGRLNIGRSSGPVSFGFASLEGATEGVDSVPTSPISSTHSSPRHDESSIPIHTENTTEAATSADVSLHSELDNVTRGVHTVERAQETDSVNLEHKSMVTSPVTPPAPTNNNTGRVQTRKEQRSGNTLYQELSFQDADALGDMDDGADITGGWVHPGEYASSVNDNFFGMGKEVENLIMENNELLATKNALNVVKDDLIVKVDELTGEVEMLREEIFSLNMSRDKLRTRVSDLEEELKKIREANENKPESAEDEADVPMAQRKRFTRVEMARVLMERNQYKERFMELQEAVRWTEMIRASRNDPTLDKKSKQSIWKFFSNLFSSSDRPTRPILSPHLRYQASTNQVAPGVRALPRPGQDFLDTELGQGSERLVARRAVERREQYRQVRAHVRKEDGRLQAYGWSLPGKVSSSGSKSSHSNSSGVPVPVPVYCRPLAETSTGMKIWCAAGVNLMGGYTRDGGLMVGGSVFYYEEPAVYKAATNEVESLDRELNATREAALLETKLSSLVWICTSTHAASIVTVIDANNPAEILNSFGVCANHLLCIASVPGASCNDYVHTEYVTKNTSFNEDIKDNKNTEDNTNDSNSNSNNKDEENNKEANNEEVEVDPESLVGKVTYIERNDTVMNKKDQMILRAEQAEQAEQEELKTTNDINSTTDLEELAENKSDGDTVNEDNSQDQEEQQGSDHEVLSSVLATMWLGAQNGMLFIHSAVANWNQCLHSVKLKDAVLSIVHVNGRVVVALADGTVAVFQRDIEGQWDLSQYHLVQLGLPQHSVRCLSVVGDKVWCGYRNKVHVVDPKDLYIVHSLEAHPRKESQVRQLAWLGEGVWVSIRLDSTLRLYHAHTYQHLQDVDIEPYVSKMLGTGKLGFSFVRITALLISSNRLWIGTGNGVIISVPLSESGGGCTGAIIPRGTTLPGTGVRIAPIPGSYVPYCTMAHAQLSFHGHRDAVKFFVSVPGNGGLSAASTPSEAASAAVTPINGPPKVPAAMLVMSGGEGYIDFRIGDGEMEESIIEDTAGDLEAASQGEAKGERSHLIVWQVSLG